ncbi:hypothetical protein [Brevibacillus agri]|uniref:hypothetical protein n=1 Tax=Brevibacillus agri TaxID=51101 RepID=UPI0018CEAEB2|nr:hypothetical protein [Brevibacillus agri]MED3499390.1 hypothetical protein [Brevibacillus agri]
MQANYGCGAKQDKEQQAARKASKRVMLAFDATGGDVFDRQRPAKQCVRFR